MIQQTTSTQEKVLRVGCCNVYIECLFMRLFLLIQDLWIRKDHSRCGFERRCRFRCRFRLFRVVIVDVAAAVGGDVVLDNDFFQLVHPEGFRQDGIRSALSEVIDVFGHEVSRHPDNGAVR